MTRFLFWNLKRNPLQNSIANLAKYYEVDVFIFAECEILPDQILEILNQEYPNLYDYAPSVGCEKIRIFTRFSQDLVPAILETNRLSIRHLQLPRCLDILIAAIHFPDKLHWSVEDQTAECSVLAGDIRKAEMAVGHSRTILVGDLNMNPFDAGVVSSVGLHGVMSRQTAKRKVRLVQEREYYFFYNPMWGLFGDASPDPPGTFYASRGRHVELFWYMTDQVLIRPDLLARFKNSDLRILSSDGENSLLTNAGIPNKARVSDHLPIIFTITL